MIQQRLEIFRVNITDCVIQSWRRGVCGSRPTKKNEPQVDYEPRSVNEPKQCINTWQITTVSNSARRHADSNS